MTLEGEYFKRMAPDFAQFPLYGFEKDDAGNWTYQTRFLDDAFRAEITVSPEGEVSGKVIDLDLEEEYLPLRVPSEIGAFVGTVREEYANVLGDIADHCFYPLPFVSPQANRIAAKVLKLYGDQVARVMKRNPRAGAFRHKVSEKWYGFIMPVSRSKVDPDAPKLPEEKGPKDQDYVPPDEVEILNVKVAKERLEDFLEEPGIYEAWHMNKKSWVSIILDGTVPDERILGMLEVSRRLTAGRSNAKKSGGRIDTWLVPANPRYYDIEAAFEKYNEIIWKQSTKVQVGDIAYMYVAAPVSAILFKCVITETDIPYEHFGSVKIKKVMKIKYLEKYPRDLFPLKTMKKHGVGTVQGCHGMPEEMERYIKSHTIPWDIILGKEKEPEET